MSPTGPISAAAAAATSSAAAHEYFKGELLTGTGDAYEIEALSEPQGQHLALFLLLTVSLFLSVPALLTILFHWFSTGFKRL